MEKTSEMLRRGFFTDLADVSITLKDRVRIKPLPLNLRYIGFVPGERAPLSE